MVYIFSSVFIMAAILCPTQYHLLLIPDSASILHLKLRDSVLIMTKHLLKPIIVLIILSISLNFSVNCYADSYKEYSNYKFHKMLDRVIKTAYKYEVYDNETADSFISKENGIYYIYVPNKSMKNYLDKVFGSYEYVQYTYDPPQRVKNTSKKRYIDFKDGKKEYINGWYTGNSGNPGLYKNGWRLTGWQEYDGEKYFMFENGGYATGLYQIGDDLHFFSDNGKYIKTCNIKDYKGTNENLRKDALRRLDRYARD